MEPTPSQNAQILKQILDRIAIHNDSIESYGITIGNHTDSIANMADSIIRLDNKLARLETTVHTIKEYISTESEIYEHMSAAFLHWHLQYIQHGMKYELITFGNFYEPYNNEPLTDIDGCLIARSPETTVKTNNGYKPLNMDRVYFIEAKHALTKTMLDKKLRQFVKILEIIRNVQQNQYVSRKKKYLFDDMIHTHDIANFPTDVVFMLAADKISPDAMKLAFAIAQGNMTEQHYNEILLQSILSHKLISDALNNTNVHAYVKKQLSRVATLQEFHRIIHPIQPAADAPASEHDFYAKKATILPYTLLLDALMVPYSSYRHTMMTLKGKIGFINKYRIQMPESIGESGFDIHTAIMNLMHQPQQPQYGGASATANTRATRRKTK